MNIDELTVGEVKQLKSLLGAGSKKKLQVEQKRVVLVVDRGWIFAGDQSVTSDGYVKLTNALHVFKWSNIGFAKMIADPLCKDVDLRPCSDVEVPADAIVFRVPVPDGWGKK